MARARWDADRARRDAEEPARLAELALQPPVTEGTAIGVLEWRDLRSGEVRRWTVLRGDRVDRVVLRAAADGRKTGSHGWTWILEHLRGYLAGTKGAA